MGEISFLGMSLCRLYNNYYVLDIILPRFSGSELLNLYEYRDSSVFRNIDIFHLSRHHIPEEFNPLKPELNPICYLLALLGAQHFLHVSRIGVKLLTFRLLMSYIYGAPILDVSRSHTTTQHSR